MKILFVVGSLRQASFNRQMAAIARRMLEGKAEVAYASWSDIPIFNQDEEWPNPHSVERLKGQFLQADGIWFFTPEYNADIPGGLKNMIDWLSRPLNEGDNWKNTALAGKKATISTAGGNTGGKHAFDALAELLGFVMMDVMTEDAAMIRLSPESFSTDLLEKTPGVQEALKKQADAFLEFVKS